MSQISIKTNFLETKDKKLFYVELGTGFPIIILPGWSSYIDKLPFDSMFIENISDYLLKYRIIIVHLSNFYKSSISKTPYTLEDYSVELFEFVNKMQITKFHLVGHSAGGRLSICFQNHYPLLVDKLVLMNSAGLKHRNANPSQVLRAVSKFSRSIVTGQEKDLLQKTFTNIYNSDLTEIIKDINIYTLIIWGKRDRVISVNKAYTLHKLIKNSKLEIFDHLEHTTIDKYEPFEKIFQFLDED